MEKPNDIMESKTSMADISSNINDSSSSWAISQYTNKSMDVIDAINRLLSMYQPDDGIAAYERVLKTLLVLSENFDDTTRQQIISVVQLPKGASDEAIRDVIRTTTTLIGTKISACQKITVVPEDKLNTKVSDGNTKITQKVLSNVTSQNMESDIQYHTSMEYKNTSELVSSVSEVFRGFPPNEISMVHSHVKNVNHAYDTLHYNLPCLQPCVDVKQNFTMNVDQQADSLKLQSNLKFKCFHTPHLLYKSAPYQVLCQQDIFKSLDNKCFQLPINNTNNYNQRNVNSTCMDKKSCRNEVVNKQDMNEILNLEIKKSNKPLSKPGVNYCQVLHPTDNSQESRKYNNDLGENRPFVESLKYFEQELKSKQQAIQEDIYKMDFVRWAEENENVARNTQVYKMDSSEMDNLTMHKRLKTSLQNFLKRAEREISVELPVFPQTGYLHTVSPTSRCWKFATTQKCLEHDNQLGFLCSTSTNSETTGKYQDTMVSENAKKLVQKKTLGPLNVCTKLDHDPAQLQVLKKNLDFTLGKAQAARCEKQEDTENSSYKCTTRRAEQNNVNVLQQAASITELASFKKQYYDTLLSIQKAKVAVANSLAMSSVESPTRYDPYYSNYSYQQQQQLLRQQGQLTVSPQFAMHTVAQSGLSNMHGTPYTWVKYNDWRHPMVRQLRFQRQSPSVYSRNKENVMPQYTETMCVQRFMQEKNKQAKQCVQRKKLEDIVGKLKEVESNNVHN